MLEQRGRWFRNPAYSKPLLATVPMPWTGGPQAFRTWFFTDSSWSGTPAAAEDIPARWRTAF